MNSGANRGRTIDEFDAEIKQLVERFPVNITIAMILSSQRTECTSVGLRARGSELRCPARFRFAPKADVRS
jgi:hypothetical protein